MPRWIPRSVMLLGLALLVGCAAPRCADPTCVPYAAGPELLACEAVERQPIEPDVSAILPRRELSADPPHHYCRLTEEDAHALAVRNATLANLLEGEAAAIARQPRAAREEAAGALTRQILMQLARHERNRSAADALEAYLRLVEAEAGHDNLARRLKQTDRLLSDIEGIQARGLVSPVTRSETAGQRLELVHRQAELRITSDQLHDQLTERLRVVLEDSSRVWPAADLTVVSALPPLGDAVQRALEQRGDLAALRIALRADEQSRLAAARLLLPATHPALGLAAPQSLLCILHGSASAAEAAVRTQQLAQVLADREQAVEQEVTRTLHAVATRLEQIGVTRARLEVARTHAQAVQQQRTLQAGGALQVGEAQLAILAVEQDLLHDVIEWKIAVVRLAAAQGALGY